MPSGEIACSDPDMLIGLLELYRKTKRGDYIEFVCKVADNILADRFHDGLFVEGPDYRYTRLDRPEPLALLHLVSVIRKRAVAVPTYWPNQAFFACGYDGRGRQYDSELIYLQRK
jgi:hypothetical protein